MAQVIFNMVSTSNRNLFLNHYVFFKANWSEKVNENYHCETDVI